MATMNQHALNESNSPIGERELIALKTLSFDALSSIARQLPAAQRARVAAFCYGKSHLHDLGLSVAACCSASELGDAFGRNARIVEAQAKAALQERMKRDARAVGPRTSLARLRA
jgi:hypothetical protein